MSSSNRLIVATLVVAVLAVGFWMLLLAPKREEADKLSEELDSMQVTLAQASTNLQTAEAAKSSFPDNYRQLIVLGEAVPEGDETSSLLVELNRIARKSKVGFEMIQLNGGGEGGEAASAPPVEEAPPATESTGAVPAANTIAPTEAAASVMPLGATIGPAGLAVMPYTLNFKGTFFQIADFLNEVDALIDTKNLKVGVDGRLVTIDGFSLALEEESNSNVLEASFVITTYVIPPGEGVTAGATPTEPASTGTPTSSPVEEPAEGGEAQ